MNERCLDQKDPMNDRNHFDSLFPAVPFSRMLAFFKRHGVA